MHGDAALCLPTARLLLDRGADPNGAGPDGEGPLHKAVQADNVAMIGLLLARGATPDAWRRAEWMGGSTPLMQAAWLDRADAVRALVAGGADPNAPGQDGRRPLHEAVRDGNLAMVDLLVSLGADLDARDDAGRTPLAARVALPQRTDPALVAALLDRAADPGVVDGEGRPLLHLALGEIEVVRLLLAHGADPAAVDGSGWTALDLARERALPLVAAILGEARAAEPALLEQLFTFLRGGLVLETSLGRTWFSDGRFQHSASGARWPETWSEAVVAEHLGWHLLHGGAESLLAEGRQSLGTSPLGAEEARLRLLSEAPALVARLALPLEAGTAVDLLLAGLFAGAEYVHHDKEEFSKWCRGEGEALVFYEANDFIPEGRSNTVDAAGFRSAWGERYEPRGPRLFHPWHGRDYLDQALAALGAPTELCWLATREK